MKKRKNSKRFKNSFLANKIPIIIASLLLITLLSFLIIYNNYKEVFVIDIDGYMIGNSNLDQLKLQKDPEEEIEITRVNVKSEESIMKNSFNHYIANGDKSTVNVEYPLYVNDGLTIINYNDNTNLLNTDFERTTGLPNSVLSYGKLYDNVTYTQIDQESYLFLSYQDGIFINLYDMKIETIVNTYTIPVNSFIYFFENQINYFSREENGFVKRKILDVDLDSVVTFYYLGGDESYEYSYEDVITLTGSVYIQEELPPVEITPEPEPEPEPKPKPEKPTTPKPKPEQKPPRDPAPPAEKYWAKPTVTSTPLTAQVYSLQGKITINDPAGVIVKEPTYTLYINSKVSTRRTYYQTSDVIISGLSSETEYVVIGTYTYMDSDWETKKIVTFFVETYQTKARTNLEKIDVSFGLGKIYPRKMELKNLQITSSLNSEAIRGVKKIGIRVEEETFILNTSLTQSLLKGERVTVTSTDILKSNKVVNFKILFFDKDNNIIDAMNNEGTTRTCKQTPTLFLKIIKNDNINMTVSLDLRNDDKVELKNYRYILVNSAKEVIQSGTVKSNEVEVTNLDPDRVFTLKIYADMDFEDGNGTIEDIMLKDINLVTLPISSLGYIHLKPSISDVTASSSTVKVEMNHNRTDSRLVKLLKSITMRVYDLETNSIVYTEEINGDALEALKERKSRTIELKNLESFKQYRVEFTSLVRQGNTNYNLECIYSLDKIYTRKIVPTVNITHMFVNEEMIDFDINITDPKNAILTEEVIVELRDKKNKLVNTTIVKTNKDLQRITYNNLETNQQYTINIYADEYNETNLQIDYKSKYLLYSLTKTTRSGISGSISPISSERKTTGKNIVDVASEIKWYQTELYYTIPKTVDSSNNLHIYSKQSTADYSYDLSEYEGKRVTVTFSIRSLTPELTNRKVYVTNYYGGTTSATYAQDVTNNTAQLRSFTYTFRVGSKRNSSTDPDAGNTVCSDKLNGKNRCNFLGFYVTGGDSEKAEFVIENLMAYVSEDEVEVKTYTGDDLAQGMYNTNGVEQTSVLDVRTTNRIELSAGYSYQFNYNTETAYIYFFRPGTTASIKQLNNVVSGQTYKATENVTALVFMRNPTSADPLTPDQVTLEVKKLTPSTTATFYEPFQYNLETKVKVNLTDLYSEIHNNKYFIRVYENGQEVTCPNDPEKTTIKGSTAPCYVYDDTTNVKDIIHQIDLKEKKNYVVELAVYINDRFYTLSSFEISTDNEVKGISTVNDWLFIQPRGHYILLNDLSLAKYSGERIGYGYRYFYGEIDFQGHTLSTYSSSATSSDTNGLAIIYRIEESAVIKNLVLEVHQDQEFRTTGSTGFITYNYGTIENVMVNFVDETEENLTNQYISPLVTENKVSGRIRNFVVNVVNETSFYSHSSLLVRTNYGLIENGYIYGENIVVDPIYTSNDANLGLVQVYGGTRSVVRNVYTLPSLVHSTDSQLIGGLVSYETYGTIEDVYTIGDSNGNKFANGPVVGYVRATANLTNVFYYNKKVYTESNQQKTTATALNDVAFQESLLGDAFKVEDLVKIGYYPHVKFTTTKMPPQPYLELPVANDKKNVDIVSMKIINQSTSQATVEFSISNPEAAQIREIVISDLDCEIKFQTYEEGTTTLTAVLSKPVNYLSKYTILSISTESAGYESTREYSAGEKYANVAFYKEIYTVADWKKINDNYNQNYALMNDLTFFGQSDFYISTFSGTLDGRGYSITDATIAKSGYSGIFNNFNGTLKNITFKNIKKTTDTEYGGVIGQSNAYAVFSNVHVENIEITIPENTTRTSLKVGGLVGYSGTSKFQDCSVTNPIINSNVATSGIAFGGLIGRTYGGTINNSFVRNVNIRIEKSIGVEGVGGLVGKADDGTGGDTIILNTYTTGSIVNNNIYTGGIVGVNSGLIETSYSTINLSGDLGYVGGIAGFTNSSAGSHLNNLYLGNIYTPKNGTKIIPNVEVGKTNFSMAGSLINGVKSSLTYGEDTVTREELYKTQTYEDKIVLGQYYDYSKASEGVLPKLYNLEGTELLPNQPDLQIPSEQINITDLTVIYERNHTTLENDNSAAMATLTFDTLPEGYKIVGAIVEGGTKLEVEQTGPTTATIYFEPERYYDYYKLSGLRVSINGVEETQEKQNILNIKFYKRITTIDEWNQIDSNYPENYYLATDIDLSLASVQTNIIVNSLIGETKTNPLDENDTKYSIYNYTEAYTANRTGVCIFEKVISGISNIKFRDISITDTSKSTNSYVNIIRYNYGEMSNIDFSNITLNAYNEEYVAPIGINYGQEVHDITLDTMHIEGSDKVAGLIAYAENGEERKYYNIHGTNLNIRGKNHRIAGIFGAMRVTNEEARYLIHDISVKNSQIEAVSTSGTYVGGITGYGDCTRYCSVSNTTILGSRYVGGISGYQMSVYSRDLEAHKVTITGRSKNAYYVGGLYGYSRRVYRSYVTDSTITFNDENAYGLGGLVGYMGSYYYLRSNGVSDSTIGGVGKEIGGLVGRNSSGETYVSYVQDCTISGTSLVGGVAGTHRGGWLLRNHVTRTTITADTYAGGMIGRLGSTETSHGYTRETYVSDSTVYANSHAGGLFGGLSYSLYYPNSVYSLYFEGSITAKDGQAGLATGDEFNTEVLPLNRIVFYENTTVNSVKAFTYAVPPTIEKTQNMLGDIKLVEGYYLGDKGEQIYNRSYPNAAYGVDYIKLEGGKTYTVGVNVKSGYDWFRVKVYDLDGTFNKDMTSASTNYYPRAYNFSRQNQVTFRIFRDCYIRVMFYDKDAIEGYYLYETKYGENNINSEQLVDYNDLTSKVTWARYSNDTTSYDYVYASKLYFDNTYFDFTRIDNEINGVITSTTTPTSDGNKTVTASGIVTAMQKEGLMFDGLDDSVTIGSEFVQPTYNFTVSARVKPISNHIKDHQFLYFAGSTNDTNKGFGIAIRQSNSSRRLYVLVNGDYRATDAYLPLKSTSEVTVTYSKNATGTKYTLRLYVNGEQRFIKEDYSSAINLGTAPITQISPQVYRSNTTNARYTGIYERLIVYNSALAGTLIKNGYSSDSWITENQILKYDFRQLDSSSHYNESSSYPTLIDAGLKDENDVPLVPKYQEVLPEEYDETQKNRLTPLPYSALNNRAYFNVQGTQLSPTTSTLFTTEQLGAKISILDRAISDIYKVYPSSHNTVNIEFNKVYSDVRFKFKNGDYESEYERLENRVYSLSYDYKNDLIITIKSSNAEKEIVLTSKDLARTVQIVDNNYYHIENNALYKNDKKIVEKAYTIYNNIVLLDNNQIYDLTNNETYSIEQTKGFQEKEIPLSEYNVENRKVETFYNFSRITDLDGNIAIRSGQIHVRDEKIYIFDSNSTALQDMNVYHTYNTEEYQISLIDGHLISIKSGIKLPSYFSNNNIIEVENDTNSKDSIIIVRYQNGYVVAFDYYTGKELFTYGTKEKVSLVSYIGSSLSGEYVLSSSNNTYKESNKLKETLTNVTDQEVKDKLSSPLSTPSQEPVTSPDGNSSESNSGTNTPTNTVTNDFVQVYNTTTGQYEVYSTNDILNAGNTIVENTSHKISRDVFLYNYFQGEKKNTFFEKTKVTIITIIIGLVIINLILFIKNINTKEVKHEKVKTN